MAGLPEYSFLSKEPNTESRFISRLKLMIQNQNIQQKYTEAITALKTEDVSRVGDRQAIAVDS